jgi:XTP/dITP diphosphohydrolase
MDLEIFVRASRLAVHHVHSGENALKRRELLVATGNAGKLRELRDLLGDEAFTLVGLADLPHSKTVPETGATFTENASIKAAGYARQAELLTLADDSGLEVDALDGAPGVWSARYLGEDASYPDRMQALLSALRHTASADRSARFVCAAAIANSEGTVLHVSLATCEGRIAPEPRGSGGFGYDPIFVPQGFELTFAELPPEIKNRISHRARALEGARNFLHALTDGSHAD